MLKHVSVQQRTRRRQVEAAGGQFCPQTGYRAPASLVPGQLDGVHSPLLLLLVNASHQLLLPATGEFGIKYLTG